MKYTIYMKFEDDDNWYRYGADSNRDKANEIAMQVRDSRNCEVKVIEE